MRAKQLSFFPKPPLQHGGERQHGRRKTARPFDPKRPLHVTLHSSRARGAWSLLSRRNRAHVESLTFSIAKKWDVRVYRFANVGSHVHLLTQARNRRNFQAFLREWSGTLAAAITGAKKGNPCGRFWDHLAWSRVVGWGRDLREVIRYIAKNVLEAEGRFSPRDRAAGVKVISLWSDAILSGRTTPI